MSEKKEFEYWINVYDKRTVDMWKQKYQRGKFYASKTEADENARPGRVACLRLQFNDGDGLRGDSK
jgi:hypothetical protein